LELIKNGGLRVAAFFVSGEWLNAEFGFELGNFSEGLIE